MTDDTHPLEEILDADLDTLDDRFTDERFATELYRALADNRWRKEGEDGQSLALSWSRAEALVNAHRRRCERPELELAQTGGEGEVSDLVRDELGRLGWSGRPLDTSSHDPAHASTFEGSPPREDHEPPQWEQDAHAEAERTRLEH